MEEQLKRLAEEMEQARSLHTRFFDISPGHNWKIRTFFTGKLQVRVNRKTSLICCACPGSDRLLFELLDLFAYAALAMQFDLRAFYLGEDMPLSSALFVHYSL